MAKKVDQQLARIHKAYDLTVEQHNRDAPVLRSHD